MKAQRHSNQRIVLHVGVDSPTDTVSVSLRACGLEVESCPDVYRALARLERGDAGRFEAVVVCLDRLARSELEFVALARRALAGASVYVYAVRRSRGWVRQAVELGAARAMDATPEGIRAAFLENGLPRETGSIEDSDAESGGRNGPVAVPWSVGVDRPQRQPPSPDGDGLGAWPTSSRVDGNSDRVDLAPAHVSEVDDGPLLTPEEIRWLLDGEDLGAMSERG